jgi:hypothetical protein
MHSVSVTYLMMILELEYKEYNGGCPCRFIYTGAKDAFVVLNG